MMTIELSTFKGIAILLGLVLMLPIVGCQQTKLVFTDTQTPVISQFVPLKNAPKLTSTAKLADKDESKPGNTQPKVTPLTPNFTLHQFPASHSGLHYISLVLINSQRPFKDIDVLNTALYHRANWLSAQKPLSCIESLKVRAGMHSIALQMACPTEEIGSALSILAASWQDNAFDEIDIDTVRRQLKLNKHISAFTGSEIEKVWAREILGERHPYNLALNNQELQQALTQVDLIDIQGAILPGSKWHLLISGDDTTKSASLDKLALGLAKQLPQLPSTDVAAIGSSREDSERIGAASKKQLFIIDVPGAVQTQVRVGYRLPITSLQSDTKGMSISSAPLSCHTLASWLGRSFSGRLYYDLREKRGLTYGIYGRCFDNPQARTLKFYGSTQLQHTGAFVSGILDHLKLAMSEPVQATELDAIKTFEKSKHLLANSSTVAIQASYIKRLTLAQNNEDVLRQREAIAALSALELQQMARAIFDSPPTILLRGDADLITEDLKSKLPDWQIKMITP
ncbi:peptidase M16 domain protein [Shewanella sediminis HAW-EB3]|uniref:Peptidase M16 domain protein n=1 Tax=Shewanella sediminis (strain HAW-EB3) TaxID=425104 RepID=A8G006_SHESH|nr:insulinase family protein [Shewanella sediminis]ABV38429.1 peptidase M16 domain protein [Shewanella sediminis HAW-EB3]